VGFLGIEIQRDRGARTLTQQVKAGALAAAHGEYRNADVPKVLLYLVACAAWGAHGRKAWLPEDDR
jgi:hypothetical protein